MDPATSRPSRTWRSGAAAEPPTASERAGPAVTRASLQADLLAARERAARLHSRVQHLERRLSDALGEHAWRESGLGAPADIDALHQKITHLEQQVIDLAPTTSGARRGPRRRPRHPTASSWPASTWPCPHGPVHPGGWPPPESAADFAASERRSPSRSTRRNPADPAADAHPASPTSIGHPATTSARSMHAPTPRPSNSRSRVERQVQRIRQKCSRSGNTSVRTGRNAQPELIRYTHGNRLCTATSCTRRCFLTVNG